jgi:hypothetical protein
MMDRFEGFVIDIDDEEREREEKNTYNEYNGNREIIQD